MNILTDKIGRIIFALVFGVFGINHLFNAGSLVGYVPIPGGLFWVYLTGIAHLAACVSLIIEKQTRLAALLLGLMLLIFALTIQLPGLMGAEDSQTMQMFMSNFLKDMALAGAAWAIAGKYGQDDTSGSPSGEHVQG